MKVFYSGGCVYFSGQVDSLLDLSSDLHAVCTPILMLSGIEDFLNGWAGEE